MGRQIFQTSSSVRWNSFKWLSRLVIFFLVLLIPAVWIAWKTDVKPPLPLYFKAHKKSPETNPKEFSRHEKKTYKGFADFLHAKQRNTKVIAEEKKRLALRKQISSPAIRAAFYVDWDPQAFFSLQTHISELNTVIPEWFFIDPGTGGIIPQIDSSALNLMKKHQVRILPMLSNVNFKTHNGDFDSEMLDDVLRSKKKRQTLIDDIYRYLKQNNLQGINVDFEELKESSIAAMNDFMKKLYEKLHPEGLLITQDIMADNEDFDVSFLGKYNDYVFLMAYDQHWSESVPGPVSDQKWIEKETDEIAKKIPASKIVLALAGYGYDWAEGEQGETVTYQEALSTARIFHAKVKFDNDSYNCYYDYTDTDSTDHRVYFVDAGGNFNAMRFADQYGVGGTALWRLGSEDERLWKFYARGLADASLARAPFHFSMLDTINMTTEKPDYVDDGEVLDVISNPQKGIINTEHDAIENLVSEESYQQLPTRYVIRRFGQVLRQDSAGGKTGTQKRVVLTFDDGPDPDYTPRILDILKKEQVPAVFFVVGINAESHLPLLKRIYRDGYEIGNHSFTHPNMATVSEERAETEMEATRLLIEATTGRSTILFRAPYNADAEPSKLVELKPVERGKMDGYYTVGESIDPEDWDVKHGVNADSIFNRIVRKYESDSTRGIILLHDAGGNREATVQALPRIIRYFKSRGVGFATIGEILHLPKDSVMPPVHADFIRVSGWASSIFYWMEKLLIGAFWLAIILGVSRTVFMGVLAIVQYKRSRRLADTVVSASKERVSILVPAYNEELNAVKTIENLLLQDYPDFEIIFVDDGSTDKTFAKVSEQFNGHSKVKIFTKPNGGKASALNFAIEQASGAFLVCVDADTQLMQNAITELMKCFNKENVGAVAGNVKVGNKNSILTRWQSIEYTTAQNFDRRAFDLINCITVVPGAIGAFRVNVIREAGGFTSDTLAEDCDLTMRILRKGYVVRNCSTAIAVTEVPETTRQFMKQRFRWSFGVMQSFWKNRDACFNPKFKSLGLVALPNILLFQVMAPIIAPLADILFILGLFWNRHDSGSMGQVLIFYALFLLLDVAVSMIAFAFEKEKLAELLWLLPQRFVYRQLIYVVLFRSIKKAIKGESQDWGALKRTGNVTLIHDKTLMGQR